jgi:ATPase subunit of ABC transporter with duplicated ATPase domains
LVGVNWAWKTTLFSILSGEDKEFEWNISFNTRDPLIGYMKQEVDIDFSDISGRDFDLFVEKKFFDIK